MQNNGKKTLQKYKMQCKTKQNTNVKYVLKNVKDKCTMQNYAECKCEMF